MHRTFKLELSERGIDKLLRELDEYENGLQQKIAKFRDRVAEEIKAEAAMSFSGAMIDDRIGGGWRNPDVSVEVGTQGEVSVVIANGIDAVFVEFGAGVYHNGAAGSSPHPMGSELGMTIGSYGKGFGSRKVWGYYDGDGGLALTRGTPAVMPMYNALKSVIQRIDTIAREVFAA